MRGVANHMFVLDAPAPLAGMAYPADETDWAALRELGFRRVIRLHSGDYDPDPLAVDDLPLEDLYGGRAPADPDYEQERVMDAARTVARYVEAGEGVVVHCVGGTGRTGTVLATALVLLGHSVDEAIAAVQAHRPHWPESAWQEEVVRAARG